MDKEEIAFWDSYADTEVDDWYEQMELAAAQWVQEQEEIGISLGDAEQRWLEDLCA